MMCVYNPGVTAVIFFVRFVCARKLHFRTLSPSDFSRLSIASLRPPAAEKCYCHEAMDQCEDWIVALVAREKIQGSGSFSAGSLSPGDKRQEAERKQSSVTADTHRLTKLFSVVCAASCVREDHMQG